MTSDGRISDAPSINPPEIEENAPKRAKRLPLAAPKDTSTLLVPARIINEVLYCERLMYLEWDDNYFTADGRAVHKRADRPGKSLTSPEPISEEGEPLPYTARSVWLSSEALGITAKIDVVDVEGSNVIPIEYKRGKKPDIPEGAYLPERAQLCAKVLLLREHGFQCDHGEIYYAKDRQRVTIVIDEPLMARTRDAVTKIKEIADEGELPAPLRNNPKCNGCSLVGICLPDELQALDSSPLNLPFEMPAAVTNDEPEDDPWGITQSARDMPVRRLFPARDDRLPIYVQEQGSTVRLDGERFIIQRKDSAAVEARIGNTSHVAVYGNIHVTTPALRTMLERNILKLSIDGAAERQDLKFPLRSCSGPIEASLSTRRARSYTNFRCVRAAASLKLRSPSKEK